MENVLCCEFFILNRNYDEQNEIVRNCPDIFCRVYSIIYLQQGLWNQKMEEEFLRNLVIDRCRKTFHYILKLILLLLQENILSKNISFESPSKVLKTDIETSRLGLVFCLQINQFYRASKLMRHPVSWLKSSQN